MCCVVTKTSQHFSSYGFEEMHPLLSCMALIKQIQVVGAAVMSGLPIHRSGSNIQLYLSAIMSATCAQLPKKKEKKNFKLHCDKCCNLYEPVIC